MNVSRSGRIRKKSTILTDSEFHTPRGSIIHGLSQSKISQTSESQRLETQNEQFDSLAEVNEGKWQFVRILYIIIFRVSSKLFYQITLPLIIEQNTLAYASYLFRQNRRRRHAVTD